MQTEDAVPSFARMLEEAVQSAMRNEDNKRKYKEWLTAKEGERNELDRNDI